LSWWFVGEGERNAEQLGVVDLSDENDEVSDGQHCAVPGKIRKPTFILLRLSLAA